MSNPLAFPGADYILPLNWQDDVGLRELSAYLGRISTVLPVTVVDGSPEPLFTSHAQAWSALTRTGRIRHLRPLSDERLDYTRCGLEATEHDVVVIAADDVRYRPEQLRELLNRMAFCDLLRPPDVLVGRDGGLPWPARWETAHRLLHRALGTDHPATLVVRRQLLPGSDGRAAQMISKNLELVRRVRAAGGREGCAGSVYVDRIAPAADRFVQQEVKQAYDDLARPGRMLAELSVLPMVWALCRHHHRHRIAVVGAALIALAELGRRRSGGTAVFRPDAPLWAPLWLAERAVCAWLALGYRVAGGLSGRGIRIRRLPHRKRRFRPCRRGSTGGADQAQLGHRWGRVDEWTCARRIRDQGCSHGHVFSPSSNPASAGAFE